eukprot:CAMPEP_0172738552 /NCGR_PEP_ID=MMETSP1074-20121228/120461_1 /TAXON_ID=2916 /ORGANISM="Ceratium fusus, Strain PA161109" /LENGTH=79 /DNA_ID=CAMNT_0013568203 /DNA_START=60 /DNA_END=296 /DNA_ORIENTATION=+
MTWSSRSAELSSSVPASFAFNPSTSSASSSSTSRAGLCGAAVALADCFLPPFFLRPASGSAAARFLLPFPFFAIGTEQD